MGSKVRTPVPARQRAGSVDPFTRPDGSVYFRGRIRLGDGSLHRLTIPEPFCNVEADARKYTATTQAEEDVNGRFLARKRGTPLPGTVETVSEWVNRWIVDRQARGIGSALHDKGRLGKHALPVWGPLVMTAIGRDDVERVVESLDRKILSDEGDDAHLSWKTASNVWVLVTKMFDDAANSKNRALRIRSDNPTTGVRGPERGTSKARVYLWPSEFAKLVACPAIDLRFRRL
jgi:hypothetical protein